MKHSVPAFIALGVLLGHIRTASADPAALNRAAGLYHQARYDSARLELETLLAENSWRRRDSLVIFQYLGMSWSRLGSDSQAVARFEDLLELDSLFRFPRNEDAAVLRNFQTARERLIARARAVPAGTGASADPVASPPAPDTADRPGKDLGPASFEDPLHPSRALSAAPSIPRMSLALGAIPLGGGWLARKRTAHGISLGLLQAGGLLLSIYASEKQNQMKNDVFGRESSEGSATVRWQWVQRVSLSTAVGAYLFSLIASGGD